MHVISNALVGNDGVVDSAYQDARKRLESVIETLSQPLKLRPISSDKPARLPVPNSNTTRQEFEDMVRQAKEFIAAGDIYQVVLSQRFEVDFSGNDLDLYRCLRFGNPSPYMFCLKLFDHVTLLASSPELHVRVRDQIAEIRPIAGTHHRGRDLAEDEKLARRTGGRSKGTGRARDADRSRPQRSGPRRRIWQRQSHGTNGGGTL